MSRRTEGRELSATTVAFCRDVLAGHHPGPLPADPAERRQLLVVLEVHRLLGLWWSMDSRAGRGEVAGALAAGSGLDTAEMESVAARITLQALRGTLILEAADRAREALMRAGFESLVFKGAGLIRAGVYPGTRSRAFGDADLLVRGGEPATAVKALQAVGFAPWVPWQPGRDAWLPACALSDTRTPAELEVAVDLHWRIPYGSFRSGEGERDQAALWEDADLERGLPSPEVHVLLLAEHFVRHVRVVPHLIGAADLVRLLPRVTDSARLRELAERRGSLRMLRSVLAFLRSEIGLDLAPDLIDTLEVREGFGGMRSRGLDLERLLSSGGERYEGRVRGLVGQALLQWSAADMLREMARVAYPPSDWLAHRAGAGARGAIRNRLGYCADLMRWAAGRGGSPLSPNQEFEGPTGRH